MIGDELPAAWMQRDDGSWWAVDEYGIAWPVAAFSEQAALGALGDPIDVRPLAVTDTPMSDLDPRCREEVTWTRSPVPMATPTTVGTPARMTAGPAGGSSPSWTS